MTASALSLSVELLFIRTELSTHLAPVHRLQTCLIFLLLLLLLVVVYQIQSSIAVELQQHSPLSNNTSVTTYVHQMIISLPSLFKHMNDERVAMLFQYLGDHTEHKLYLCLISLLRNKVSKSVYINLRHSVHSLFNRRVEGNVLKLGDYNRAFSCTQAHVN